MSAHVLLNLLNELGKSDKMQGLRRILSLFRKELNKFNISGARALDSIYHMTLKHVKITLKSHFWLKSYNFVIMYPKFMDILTFPGNLKTTSGLSILLHGVISLPDATSYDNKV